MPLMNTEQKSKKKKNILSACPGSRHTVSNDAHFFRLIGFHFYLTFRNFLISLLPTFRVFIFIV